MASPQTKTEAATSGAKAGDAFGGRRVSPRVAEAAAATKALHKQSPLVVRELGIALSLGLAGAAIWKVYHLNWRRKYDELQEGCDKGVFTTVVFPNKSTTLEV